MDEEIKKLGEIVESTYKKEPTGTEILYIEEIFNKLFQTLLNKQEMMTNEQFEEIMCLEYEYELYYNYHFMYEWQPMFVDMILEDLNNKLCQLQSHYRVNRLVNKIFQVGLVAVEEQAEILNGNNCAQVAWIWEEYAEQYVKMEEYEKAFEYYWKAIDRYILTIENGEDDEISVIFYDGNYVLYVSDLIYRMYQRSVYRGNLRDNCIKEISKREEKLKDYEYSYLHLAYAQYEKAMVSTESEKLLLSALETISNIRNNDADEMCLIIQCNILFQLKKFTSVLKTCEKMEKLFPESKDLLKCKQMAFFSSLQLLLKNKGNKEAFNKWLKKTSKYYSDLHVSMLDGGKIYSPIFDFYNKYKKEFKTLPNFIELFFYLVDASNSLMKQLVFNDTSAKLGYYTSLESLYYVLNDEDDNTKCRLSLFDARHMNDPNEGKVLAEYLGREGRSSKGLNYDNTFVFLKSFTTQVESLPMWVQYGDGGEGCFVQINQKMFEEGKKLVESKKDININNLQDEENYQLYNVAYYDGKKFCTSSGKDVTIWVDEIKKIYDLFEEYRNDFEEKIQDEIENVINRILNRVQYLIKKDAYKNEEEVRIFFTRFGKEHDFKETGFRKGSVPRIYINLKIETEIKAIILGPKIRNAYDVLPYLYWKLQKNLNNDNILIKQSSIDYV